MHFSAKLKCHDIVVILTGTQWGGRILRLADTHGLVRSFDYRSGRQQKRKEGPEKRGQEKKGAKKRKGVKKKGVKPILQCKPEYFTGTKQKKGSLTLYEKTTRKTGKPAVSAAIVRSEFCWVLAGIQTEK
jgi:hypothetical protein